jgi:hypothetical protein
LLKLAARFANVDAAFLQEATLSPIGTSPCAVVKLPIQKRRSRRKRYQRRGPSQAPRGGGCFLPRPGWGNFPSSASLSASKPDASAREFPSLLDTRVLAPSLARVTGYQRLAKKQLLKLSHL